MGSGTIPYPAIGRHGIVGDRRTAALVAADGTVDWLCLPDYDSLPAFSALLDARRGGFWRLGPARLRQGEQQYAGVAPILTTRWRSNDAEIELSDVMALPGDDRDSGTGRDRILLRKLTCLRGSAECVSIFRPSRGFELVDPGDATLGGADRCSIWSSDDRLRSGNGTFRLQAGESVSLVLSTGSTRRWSVAEAERLTGDAETFWTRVSQRFEASGDRVVRSAITIRLLEFAPSGAAVAAPTTSLPERIGGSWNADYRLAWVRDASLAMATLAALGDRVSARRYLEWLTTLGTATEEPLQVVYGVRGETAPRQRSCDGVEGYRASTPVRIGNHAHRQRQLDIFGYLADCAAVYVGHGGEWHPSFSALLRRVAGYVATHWTEDGNGIWELPVRRHYVSSLVMCWTALDRTLRLGNLIEAPASEQDAWRNACDSIRREVEARGWSQRLGAFKQSIESDALDASALLIPLSGFLPIADPRVRSTVEQIAARLTIDDCVYRFDPDCVEGIQGPPMGQYEAAFLPCTFWLGRAFALLGRTDRAREILETAERAAGRVGLLAEALDPRGFEMAGNTPLLFSHVEHIRAVQALEAAESGGTRVPLTAEAR